MKHLSLQDLNKELVVIYVIMYPQGIVKTINVNKMVRAGCKVKIWIADWFAQLQQDGRRPEENPDSRALHDRDLESGWDEP